MHLAGTDTEKLPRVPLKVPKLDGSVALYTEFGLEKLLYVVTSRAGSDISANIFRPSA